MSAILIIGAEREIFVPAINKSDIQYCSVEHTWNTTTKESRQIHTSEDPIAEYIKIIINNNKIDWELTPIYHFRDQEGDFFSEYDLNGDAPCGYVYHSEKMQHIDEIKKWAKYVTENGYKIKTFLYE